MYIHIYYLFTHTVPYQWAVDWGYKRAKLHLSLHMSFVCKEILKLYFFFKNTHWHPVSVCTKSCIKGARGTPAYLGIMIRRIVCSLTKRKMFDVFSTGVCILT